jgi:asparagine synthetase B (glutamine-hydrolysing)
MCGILFTNFDITKYDLNHVLEFLKNRGPDITSVKYINNYTFIHTLLSMTGPPTEQPFYNNNKTVICIFNGEIYNFKDFDTNYLSDGECLIPLYEKYGNDFMSYLDGEFAIILVDFNKNILIFSTDIFSTRPLWIGFNDNKFGISTYKSCLDRIGLLNNFQILANKSYVLDLETIQIINENRIHTFDLTQFKTNFDDWNKAFAESIKKRTQYAKCGIFIGLSGGYDSGAIGCELTKQNINFTAYSIINTEDKNIMHERSKIIKDIKLIDLNRNDFLNSREYLKKNAEEYKLNIDNGENNTYNKLLKSDNPNINTIKNILNMRNFRKNEQILTNDNGAIGCSYISSIAKKNNQKIYLSGSGADEIFSDYGFNGIKIYSHSTIGGYFPEKLETVFPWRNFFRNTQRAYLMKEEHVAGAYGIEGRYPFLDKFVVQEFLWLTHELKNKEYKSPLDNYLKINNFPYEKNQKIGFNCGFLGPSLNDTNYNPLSDKEKETVIKKKIEMNTRADLIVNFEELNSSKIKSYENFDIIDKKLIKHIDKFLYTVPININFQGLKYCDKNLANIKKDKYILQENNSMLKSSELNHNKIRDEGNGLYCFWTSTTLYFSTSDNSDPRTNNYEYSYYKKSE